MGQKRLHIGFRKKIIVFRRKPLASFFDKCISIFNKTPANGAIPRQPGRASEEKKERQDNSPPLKKNSQNAFAHQ